MCVSFRAVTTPPRNIVVPLEEYVHPIGYKTLVGEQMRYAVHDRYGRPLAVLGFSTTAWKLAPRDSFIGWTSQLREKNLLLVIENPRFLILPWIEIPNLGSQILPIVLRRQLEDRVKRCGTCAETEDKS